MCATMAGSWSLIFFCYTLALGYRLKELEINYHFYADETDHCFIFNLTLSQCMFDDILTSIQRWFSTAKLKLNAEKSDYIIFWQKFQTWFFTSARKW